MGAPCLSVSTTENCTRSTPALKRCWAASVRQRGQNGARGREHQTASRRSAIVDVLPCCGVNLRHVRFLSAIMAILRNLAIANIEDRRQAAIDRPEARRIGV